MGDFVQDLRFALRSLVHDKTLTAMVVVCLALGIGANTAIFSIVDGVLMRPLPYDEPDELVVLWEMGPNFRAPASGPDYLDWRQRSTSFESLAVLSPGSANLTGDGEPERLSRERVSVNILELLRVAPARGRDFRPGDAVAGARPVAIIGDGLWRRRFGADPGLVGRNILLDGVSTTVIGVLPAGFDLPSPWSDGRPDELLTPLLEEELREQRGGHWLLAFGRVGPGATVASAAEEMAAIGAALAAEYPDSNGNIDVRVVPLHQQLTGEAAGQLVMLLAAAGFVLLIACGNVAGLLVARSMGRAREVGIRLSLGASHARLVRQLFTEAVPLAALGCAAGLALAAPVMGVLRALVPATVAGAAIGVDARTFVFSLALAGLTGVMFSLAPVISLRFSDLRSVTGSAGASSPTGGRLHGGLAVVQIALTLVLANGAALMLTSYRNVAHAEYGFDRDNVLTVSLSLGGEEYDNGDKVHAFYEQVLARLQGHAGIEAVGAVSKLPLEGGTNTGVTTSAPGAEGDEGMPIAEVSVATPEYFDAMGIALLAGRSFTPGDSSTAAPGVLVNRALAQRLWPETNAVGKRFRLDDHEEWATVVGVVEDVRQFGLERRAIPEVYFPYLPGQQPGQTSFARVRHIAVRGGEMAPLVAAVREAVLAVDDDQPLADVRTMGEVFDGEIATRRINTVLTTAFAGIAAALVAAGIFGLMSYFVQRRRREIGIRMALGARGSEVVGLVLRRSLRLAVVGIALGLGGALASTRIIAGFLYDVDPVDAPLLGTGALLLLGLVLLSSWLPARGATRVHPTIALRADR